MFLPPGLWFPEVAAGGSHSAFLRIDGMVECIGDNRRRQCDIPNPPPGVAYTQVSAGGWHTVLLQSDGKVRGPIIWHRHRAVVVVVGGGSGRG